MSRGASGVRTQNSEGGRSYGCVAHSHAIAVCQVVEAATRVVKWSDVKRKPSVYLSFEQDFSQQQIGAEQMRRSARSVLSSSNGQLDRRRATSGKGAEARNTIPRR